MVAPLEGTFDAELLVELTEAHGVPGYEEEIREIVRRELDGAVDEIAADAMGNVVGTIRGDADYAAVVAAHMDEIGFMVRHVDEDGAVTLDPLGGFDPRVLQAQRVWIHTAEDRIPGVIGLPPPHTSDDEDRKEIPPVKELEVDLGLPSEEVNRQVSVGDLVTLDQRTKEVGNTITGKALDDRVSLFVLLEVARRLAAPDVTVHFAATVQEEVGLRGAHALGVDLDPDLAIALDVTVANDVLDFDEDEHVTQLGEGAAIKLKDASVITNPKVNRRLREVADREGIAYQTEVLPQGGTDTAGFQRAAGAKPVGAISIPTRYLHSVTEMVSTADVVAARDLLTAFLETETGEHDYVL